MLESNADTWGGQSSSNVSNSSLAPSMHTLSEKDASSIVLWKSGCRSIRLNRISWLQQQRSSESNSRRHRWHTIKLKPCLKAQNQKHLPQMGATQNCVRRNVNEASYGLGSRGVHGGYGRGGCGNWGHGHGRGGRSTTCTRADIHAGCLTDGHQIENHASFNFSRHTFMKM